MPREGRISGPSTGFEVTVPGRQGIRAYAPSIPLAGAPTSIETSLRGLLFSALFLPWCRGRAACIVKLPGPSATTLKLGKPGWRLRAASPAGWAIVMFCELIDAHVSVVTSSHS